MKQQEYEQKRRECWEEYKRTNLDGEVQWQPVSRKDIFNFAFDRAYALGREKETISQEEVKKGAREAVRKEYLCEKCAWKDDCDFCGGENTAFDCCECPADSYEDGFKAGANFALGKQEKDADTVIQGWVAKDVDVQWVYLYSSMPTREKNMWNGHGSLLMPLDANSFPDLTWDDDPEPVELIIKRKK